MADCEDDFDRDDYGEDENDDVHQSLSDNDLSEELNQIKGEENIDADESNNDPDEDHNDASSLDEHDRKWMNEEGYIDLLGEQPIYPVPNKIRVTNPYISKYEKANIIGKRA